MVSILPISFRLVEPVTLRLVNPRAIRIDPCGLMDPKEVIIWKRIPDSSCCSKWVQPPLQLRSVDR